MGPLPPGQGPGAGAVGGQAGDPSVKLVSRMSLQQGGEQSGSAGQARPGQTSQVIHQLPKAGYATEALFRGPASGSLPS